MVRSIPHSAFLCIHPEQFLQKTGVLIKVRCLQTLHNIFL